MKFEGSLARNARFGSSKSPDGRSFSCFAWQVQYFRGVSISACHFGVAGAALCNVAFCICVAGAAFCDVQAQHLVTALKTCGSLAKSNTFGGM